MRSSGCPHGRHDNACYLIHFITPPSIDNGVPYSVFYYLSPCTYWYQPLWADQGAEFYSCREASLLCCFISCTHMKMAWGEKDNAVCFNSSHCVTLRYQAPAGEREYFIWHCHSVETSGRPRLLWHTWWSAALHVIMTALLDLLKPQVCVTMKQSVYQSL